MLRENDGRGATGAGEVTGECTPTAQPGRGGFHRVCNAVAAMVLGALFCFGLDFTAPVSAAEAVRPATNFLNDRKVDIQPKEQRKGIGTGLVIAYGHPIAPPYVVEYRGEKLFVNDVQVKPSIADERKWAAKSARPKDERFEHVMSVMERSITRAQDKARNGSNQQEVLRFLKAQDFIEDVVPEGQQAVVVSYFGGKSVVVELPAKGESVLRANEIAERSRAARSNEISRINGKLSRRRCVIFVNGGTSEERITSTFPAIVPQTMNDSRLSAEEKLRRLDAVLVGSAAMDLVANYDAREWSWIVRPQ